MFAEKRDRVTSKSGGWTIGGEATLHGYNIHQELTHQTSWIQVLLLSITGRLYDGNQTRLIEALFVATGYPDPRLWCNRVVALAGSARVSAGAALSVGVASAEAKTYGGQAEYYAARGFSECCRIFQDQGEDDLIIHMKAVLKKERVMFGFGRPLTRVEERIEPIERMAKEMGIEDGPHLATVKHMEILLKRYRLVLNFAGYATARLLDLGLSAHEVHQFLTVGFYLGLPPCYIEAFENEPGTFLPIACEDILYEGVEERELP
ncbi:hypothetical protein [Mariprofundus sp. KV]|uniref:hypothetical protein n=1 Tax=Mariprofundus sp. KV TaxID=2608715 RepID=UPI0015A3F852|nr:hypothetical protein [Mariprofundus sp. KV]NWF35678.1 hypothetical protein [Mariprofundus sp. KV]